MATYSTVRVETMEDVLRGCGFKQKGYQWRRQPDIPHGRVLTAWETIEAGWQVQSGRLKTRGTHVSPAHLRRIVAAEVACAAAWRGEETDR